MMYDVWCMMHDVWCMMYDVWCMMYVCMMYDVINNNNSNKYTVDIDSRYVKKVKKITHALVDKVIFILIILHIIWYSDTCSLLYGNLVILYVLKVFDYTWITLLLLAMVALFLQGKRANNRRCDVWCMRMYVWCMYVCMYDVWCMMYDVWCMMYDVWCMMYDVWCMMYVCMMYDAMFCLTFVLVLALFLTQEE